MAGIKIDTELRSLIAPLTHDEYKRLEANIIADGCRDALVLWGNVLVDGHHRYKICNKHSIPYRTEQIDMPDINAVKLWMLANQLGRRNLTDEQRTYYIGARYELEQTIGHGTKTGYQNDTQSSRIRDKIAGEEGIGSATVERAKKYKQAVDTIAGHSDTVKDSILAGALNIPKIDILQFGAVQRDNPELGKKAVDELLAGNANGFKQAIYNGKKAHQLIHQSKSNEWYTPSEYIEAARRVMGSIDLDPASCDYANDIVQASEYFTKEADGFTQSWYGNVWLNPPYGRGKGNDSNQSMWSNKLIEQYEGAYINQAILLVNAVPGNLWFWPLWNYPICFPKQRIKFYDDKGSVPQPTHGNAIVYFGYDIKKFAREFEQFGAVVLRIKNK